ncbi:MAG: hypothetical protein QXF66_01025 [Candidatus Hadarchaeales archaeon]
MKMAFRKLGLRGFLEKNWDFLSGLVVEFTIASALILLSAALCFLVVTLSSL